MTVKQPRYEVPVTEFKLTMGKWLQIVRRKEGIIVITFHGRAIAEVIKARNWRKEKS